MQLTIRWKKTCLPSHAWLEINVRLTVCLSISTQPGLYNRLKYDPAETHNTLENDTIERFKKQKNMKAKLPKWCSKKSYTYTIYTIHTIIPLHAIFNYVIFILYNLHYVVKSETSFNIIFNDHWNDVSKLSQIAFNLEKMEIALSNMQSLF